MRWLTPPRRRPGNLMCQVFAEEPGSMGRRPCVAGAEKTGWWRQEQRKTFLKVPFELTFHQLAHTDVPYKLECQDCNYSMGESSLVRWLRVGPCTGQIPTVQSIGNSLHLDVRKVRRSVHIPIGWTILHGQSNEPIAPAFSTLSTRLTHRASSRCHSSLARQISIEFCVRRASCCAEKCCSRQVLLAEKPANLTTLFVGASRWRLRALRRKHHHCQCEEFRCQEVLFHTSFIGKEASETAQHVFPERDEGRRSQPRGFFFQQLRGVT